jgi:N-acetylated-alpha-linked acidic dipeptidase
MRVRLDTKYLLCLSIAFLFALYAPISLCGQSISGFSRESARAQADIETRFKAIPSPDEARKQHRFLTAEPHPAGSERNNELARYIADLWKQQGMEDVVIRRYDVLNTFPRQVSFEMLTPVRYKAGLREDAYPVDADTSNPRVQSAYSGLSASGEVTAPVVYAHSGNPEDYDLLRKHGIDVKGKIVLVRYSNPYSYRGFKALTAEKNGAAAMVVYSDPAEDGFKRGKVFPDGPWGPESHIQRGAITYDFMVPGDPLTPGWASVEGAKRIPADQAVSLPKIIALPMSWRDAKHLLENMDGPEAPKSWQGGLPFKYRLGGSKVTAHVKVDMDNSIKPNYVVESRIRGSEFPDEWVVLGNHRDAWEFGGVDPSSGTASMIEMTRALGSLKKQGFRPRRTIVVCSWDGEEVGLTGSTEWGEQFADELRSKGVAYINVDSSASGPSFRPDAVASLAPLIVEVARTLVAPSGKTLYDEWRSSMSEKKGSKALADRELVDTRIGSGSDHTVFLNYVGLPTIGLTFDGPYGVYHSIYDDFYWMNKFGDPGYRYHILCAQVWGVLALRLANAEVLPFDFGFYGENIREFITELKKNKLAARFSFDSLLRAVGELGTAGKDLNQAIAMKLATGKPEDCAAINRMMRQFELNWLNADGIPGRPWFKHTLYAARFTYAHLELPGLTEAIERGDLKAAEEQAAILQKALSRNLELLREIRSRLK